MRVLMYTAILTLSLASAAQATTVPFVMTSPGALDYEYNSDFEFGGDRLRLNMDPVTVDISLHDELEFVFEMPAGQSIRVDPHLGASPRLLVLFNLNGGSGGGSTYVPLTSYEFIGLTGSAPTQVFEDTYLRVDGSRLNVDVDYAMTGPFSITGFRATLNADPDFFSAGELTYNGLITNLTFGFASPEDLGSQATLVVVPEPASAAMLGLGLTLLARRRRKPETSTTQA